ncbi:hypothetical protein [Paenibacillus pinistramenti]|uniref:hypothetical protein n=1 Tax=Paenibacillus pinistramenti TaxID=1768003 RepID=UPI001109C19F|nr:hypothetical protein [Paenibacillus pinistramenti]
MSNPTNPQIIEAINDLKEAKKYLESIQDDFGDDPELLAFYLPSAQEIVRQYQTRLKNVLAQETGLELNLEQIVKEPEIWIRLQGEKFTRGAGPIDAVGAFLHKLNLASHKVIKLLQGESTRFAPSFFNLVATAEGSLKLGLSRPDVVQENKNDQLELGLEDPDPWEKLKLINEQSEKAIKSLQLLIKALDSDNEESMNELQKELQNQNDILKLLHYAKDLTPSIRSSIERISFEGATVPQKQKAVSVDKQTRKLLSERAKVLKKDMLYVEGRALIRQQDMDTHVLTARPLLLEDNKQYSEVKCVFSPHTIVLDNYLDKFVSLSGFLVFGANNQPLRLEIDELSIEEEHEEE